MAAGVDHPARYQRRKPRMKRINSIIALVGSSCLVSAGALADAKAVAGFYQGKTITIVVSAGPGGGYDLYSRTLSRHFGKHIPGKPAFVLQFMPGAGGVKAANYLYNVAPEDGSVIGNVSNTLTLIQLLKGGVKFDVAKFNYIGRAAAMNAITMVWHNAPATSLEDLSKTDKILIFGSTGVGQQGDIHAKAIKNVLGYSNIKIVTGYKGSANVNMAMEKGEVHGQASAWSSWKSRQGAWVKERKIVPLVEHGLVKSPDNPGAPLILDLAKNDFEREVLKLISSDTVVGRVFVTPPGVPEDRATALREAFTETMKDSDFLADAKAKKMELWPMPGEELQEIVSGATNADPKVIAAAKKALEF
jgi:tripartite-type tricarboxylate transporter receptor subunit TctC